MLLFHKSVLLTLVSILVLHSNADDVDDLRVSSVNRFEGNYHTITPPMRGKVAHDDIGINHIGKPLYMHMPASQQQQRQEPLDGVKKYRLTETKPTQAPRFVAPLDTALRSQNSVQNTCRWISLKDVRSVNFETGEIIIRDAADQPCYIISMRAFIKFNDDAYFLLRGLKPYPAGAYKIEYYNHTAEPSGSAHHRMPLNCSFPDTSSFLIAHDQRPSDYYLFKEEIIVQLDCGYLVFKIKLDYAYQILLEAISFYQDADVSSSHQTTAPRASKSNKRNTASRPASIQQTEHLVFSTETGAPNTSPLIVMPLYSRYICQNRIVLTGSNSIQLVIDRFEFGRLITVPNDRIGINLKHRAHLHSVTKCPDLSSSATNLSFMIAPTNGIGQNTEKSATSNKLTSSCERLGGTIHVYLLYAMFVMMTIRRAWL